MKTFRIAILLALSMTGLSIFIISQIQLASTLLTANFAKEEAFAEMIIGLMFAFLTSYQIGCLINVLKNETHEM